MNSYVFKCVSKALSFPGWRDTVKEEMMAVEQSGTWNLVVLSLEKKVVGCR